MDSKTILKTIAIVVLAPLLTYLLLSQTISTVLLIGIIGFFYLSIQRPLFGLIIIILLPILGEFSRLEVFGRSLILSDLVLPIFIAAFLIKKENLQSLKKIHGQLITILLFLSIAVISLLLSLTNLSVSEVASSSQYLIRLIFYISLFPISFILAKKHFQRIYNSIIFSGLLISITGFIQLILMPSLESLESAGYDPHINRLVGSWLDPNFIGGYFAIILCFVFSEILYKKRISLLNGLTTISLSIGLFLTYSRSALLGFATGIIIIGLVKSRKLLIAIIIIGTLGVSVSDRAQQRLSEFSTSISSIIFNSNENPDPTARLRIKNWEQTWELIKQKPLLGHGYNTLTYTKLRAGYIKEENNHSASGSDSSLLTILVTTGITGLLAFITMLINLFQTSIKTYSKNSAKAFALGYIASLIAILVHSNFVNSLLFPQILIPFWVLTGLIYSLSRNFSNNNKSTSIISK